MSTSSARSTRPRPADKVRASAASARLGLTLRSILVRPRDGLAAAIEAAAVRERSGVALAEGWSPYVLAAIGGSSLMLLWLKLGGLLELRNSASVWQAVKPSGGEDYRWALLVAAVLLGALLSVCAQFVWSVLGRAVMPALGGSARARDLRIVWGASALPQIFVVLLLLPLDALIAGSSAFTTEPVDDPVKLGWTALSVALGLSLAVWSLFLFVRGVEIAADVGTGRAAIGAIFATACLVVVVAALRLAALSATGAPS